MRPPSDHPKAPSLEALLKLKRAEKPDAQFWTDFERGLRQRQLASIVEPKPWWLGLSLLARRSSPLLGGAALGAVAVLAVLFVRMDFPENELSTLALRNSSPTRAGLTDATLLDPTPAGPNPASVYDARPENASVALVEESTASQAAETSSPAPDLAGTALALVASSPQNQASGLESLALPATDFTPAPFQLAETASVAIPNETAQPTPEPGAWFVSASTPVTETEALAEVTTDAGSRHARLLANVQDPEAGPSPKTLASVRDRILHRMNDGEELYASISRVGVRGDRLSLKF